MSIIKKLQIKLLQKDIAKGKSAEALAKNYPMSLLLQLEVFERFYETKLYKAVNSNEVFDLEGNFIGEYIPLTESDSKYYIIKGTGKYISKDHDVKDSSYAIYDTNGDIVVPHGCYTTAYKTKDYMVLTMPMDVMYTERIERIPQETDDQVMESTGKTLKDVIGSTIQPRTLLVTKDRIIKTKYLSVCPSPVENAESLANNIVWIAHRGHNDEISLKFDRRMYIIETYSLPYYSYLKKDMFYKDPQTNAVYYLDIEHKTRLNLRTGQRVNLLSLAKTRLAKKDRVMSMMEQQRVDNPQYDETIEDVIVTEVDEEVQEPIDEEVVDVQTGDTVET